MSLACLPSGAFPTPIFDVVLKRITIRRSIVGTFVGILRYRADHWPRSFCLGTSRYQAFGGLPGRSPSKTNIRS